MKSQRLIAQMGLLAAVAVFVVSVGVLMTQGVNNTPKDAQAGAAKSHQSSNMPLTLSAQADSGEVARR